MLFHRCEREAFDGHTPATRGDFELQGIHSILEFDRDAIGIFPNANRVGHGLFDCLPAVRTQEEFLTSLSRGDLDRQQIIPCPWGFDFIFCFETAEGVYLHTALKRAHRGRFASGIFVCDRRDDDLTVFFQDFTISLGGGFLLEFLIFLVRLAEFLP